MNCLPLLDSCCIARLNECAWWVCLKKKKRNIFVVFADFFCSDDYRVFKYLLLSLLVQQ